MLKRTYARLDRTTELGFTLIELLIVIILVSMLLAIAVPSYIGFKDRAANNTVKSNLRAAVPSAESFYRDNGTYAGMDATALKAIDSGISPSLTVAAAGATTYCLTDTVSGKTWSVAGPHPSNSSYKNNATCA